ILPAFLQITGFKHCYKYTLLKPGAVPFFDDSSANSIHMEEGNQLGRTHSREVTIKDEPIHNFSEFQDQQVAEMFCPSIGNSRSLDPSSSKGGTPCMAEVKTEPIDEFPEFSQPIA
ncbi:hypothetical protein PMAYCL1PPCAC_19564, partial [Pristionchus mayeri]